MYVNISSNSGTFKVEMVDYEIEENRLTINKVDEMVNTFRVQNYHYIVKIVLIKHVLQANYIRLGQVELLQKYLLISQ